MRVFNVLLLIIGYFNTKTALKSIEIAVAGVSWAGYASVLLLPGVSGQRTPQST